jgi:hypothetical protein
MFKYFLLILAICAAVLAKALKTPDGSRIEIMMMPMRDGGTVFRNRV